MDYGLDGLWKTQNTLTDAGVLPFGAYPSAQRRSTLTLTSATNVTEVSVYERSTIPNSVKEGAAVMKSTRSAVRLAL